MQLLTLRRAAHASPIAIGLLVLANLVPLVGVLLFGWDLPTIVALYWLENGVIGVFAALRIATAGGADPNPRGAVVNGFPASAARLMNPRLARWIFVPFFALHYGMFWLVHGVFVWFVLPELFEAAGAPAGGIRIDAILWAIPFLLLGHGASFVLNWWYGGERYTSIPPAEMAAPYGRVVILHVTIILGAFAVAALGAPIWALVVMVGVKTVADLAAHLGERSRADHRATLGGITLSGNGTSIRL